MTLLKTHKLWSMVWLALKGMHPLTGRRSHPFQRSAVRLNCLMAAIGGIKLLAGFYISHDQKGWLSLALDLPLIVAALWLALRVLGRLLLKLKRQEGDRNG